MSVVGVPDPASGELPAAVIVKLPGYENLKESDIVKCVAGKFAHYNQLLGGVYFVDKLPMTPTGKFIKRLVKEVAIEGFNKAKQLSS